MAEATVKGQIKISGLQKDISDEAVTETHEGLCDFRNGTWFLRYENSLIKANSDMISVRRDNGHDIISYEAGRTTCHTFRLPYGDLSAEMMTHRIKIKEEGSSLFLLAEYTMSVNGCFYSECELKITFTPQAR